MNKSVVDDTKRSGSAGATTEPGNRTSSDQERSITEGLLVYLSVVVAYRWMIVGITAVAAVAVVLFSILSLILPPEESPLPNYYRAGASLLLSEQAGADPASAMLSALGVPVPSGGRANYAQIAMEVLRTRSFLDRVADEAEVVEYYEASDLSRTEIRQLILAHANFNFDERTGVLRISYEDVRPEYAARMANLMVEQLQAWFRSRGGLSRRNELESLERSLIEVEKRLVELQGEIRAFQREHGVLEVQEIAETQSRLLSELQSQLVAIEVQIRNQESLSRIENDPALARLRTERNNLAAMIRRIDDGYTGGQRPMPAREELPELALELQSLRADMEIQQRIYQTISEQYEVSRLTAESRPAFSLLEAAEVPDEKAGPNRSELCITVTLAAFAASIALAYVLHAIRSVWGDPHKRALLSQARSRSDEVTE